ncbi:hypothetical protein Tco_0959866 [Tanacetum coccineum]
MEDMDFVQKAKVRWAIEGDENSKYFHGIINKKRSNLAIRGVFVDGTWWHRSYLVKESFKDHYEARFNKPTKARLKLSFSFPNRLSTDQVTDLERHVSHDEIRLAVWDCGVNKSPGPDGFNLMNSLRKFLEGLHWTGFCEAVATIMKTSSVSLGLGGAGMPVISFWDDIDSLWFRVIQAVHGDKIDSHSVRKVSIWSSILKEVQVLKSSGFDFLSYCSKRIGDGQSTSFWKETWMGDIPLCELCPRLFALDSAPNICVAAKMAGPLDTSFRRSVRGGVEQQEFSDLRGFASCLPLVGDRSTSDVPFSEWDDWFSSIQSSGFS